jgi:hypothetical protein
MRNAASFGVELSPLSVLNVPNLIGTVKHFARENRQNGEILRCGGGRILISAVNRWVVPFSVS